MRVIYSIGAKFAGGGIGTTAYYAVRGLHGHGMLQRLLCGSFRPSEIPREKIQALGLPSRALCKLATYDRRHYLWHVHNVLFDAWAAHRLVPADIFHVWHNHGLRSLKKAKALGMVTVVQRASTHPLWQARILREEYARWGLKFHIPPASLRRGIAEIDLADYVLIPSEFVRTTFLEEGFPPEKLLLVPFGVDTARFRPSKKAISHPFRLLFVGQVSIRKGLPYLLEAWQRLSWRDAELWIVGRPSAESAPVMNRYRALPGVHWKGHVSDPVSLFQQADVFVFPTVEEGSALVTYEALACGLPVVTTPNAGSVVRDGVEGFIVPIRDVDALAGALERLRGDERLRREMSKAARTRAEAFTWEQCSEQLVKAMQCLMEP